MIRLKPSAIPHLVNIWPNYSNKNKNQQENAMRCNNRDNLLQLSFSLKISIFFRGLCITQSNIYDGAFFAKIVSP